MRQRTIIFVVLAAFFGLGTIYFARSWISSQRADHVTAEAKPQAQGVSVMVAARDLPTGAFVRPEDLRWQSWPDSQVADNYLLKGKDTPESLSGAVVRQAIAAGQPVTANRVIKPGDRGFLAAVLSPGMRAISVTVTPVSDIAGLVFPGDHVDIILAHHVQMMSAKKTTTAFVSETVLTNLRVLATDQSTGDLKNKPKLAHTVTLETTPKQAEALEVANSLGKLYLSLRGLPGSDPNNDTGVIGDDGLPVQRGVESVSHVLDSDISPLIHHHLGAERVVTILRGTGGETKITIQSTLTTSGGPHEPAHTSTTSGP